MTDNNNTKMSESDRLFQEKGSTHDFNLSDSERALQPASPLLETNKDVDKDSSTKKDSSSESKSAVSSADKSKRITQKQHQVSNSKSHKK